MWGSASGFVCIFIVGSGGDDRHTKKKTANRLNGNIRTHLLVVGVRRSMGGIPKPLNRVLPKYCVRYLESVCVCVRVNVCGT